MNSYEQKQEDRRTRYRERATKAAAAAAQFRDRADAIARCMNGQPILIGHHSEKRHRAAIGRLDGLARKVIAEREKAAHYLRRANSIGESISSDDPDAVAKLQSRLEDHERAHGRMKVINDCWRLAGKPGPDDNEGWQSIAKRCGETGEMLGRVRASMRTDPLSRAPFPPYALQNSSAEGRRLKKRIASLEAARKAEHKETRGAGYVITEDPAANRIRMSFNTKPSRETCRAMRQGGFRFSRQSGAWQRQLNNAGRYAAQYIAERIARGELELGGAE